MRNSRTLLLSLLLSVPIAAQTPGVAGVNDYWITPGGTPGGTSCKGVTLTTPLTMSLNVTCKAGTPFVMFWFACPCVACWSVPAMGTSSCLTPPTSACSSSNQFLEVGIISPCPLVVSFSGVATAAGAATIPINVPLATSPFLLSSQTVFLGPTPCVVSPWSLLFSQAWNVKFQ